MSKRIKFLFEWRDLWVGVFVDTKKCKIYILPLPTVGVVVDYGRLAVMPQKGVQPEDWPSRPYPLWTRLPERWRWW